MSANSIYRGDDTAAFGHNFIRVKIKNPALYPLSKIEAVTNGGCCIKNIEITDPDNFKHEEITLFINYDSDDTQKLYLGANTLNMVAYDMQNRRYTCKQTFIFYAQNGVITKNGKRCKRIKG